MIIAVAYDIAFSFVYQANLDDLRRLGELRFFSPLKDNELPQCDLLYLPGGYPELYSRQLADNKTMMASVKDFVENGGMVFAECGGFLYLCHDIDGVEMCGVFNITASMVNFRLHLGYRSACVGGIEIKGHEFHYSDIRDSQSDKFSREIIQKNAKGADVDTPIYRYKNVIAGYTHWYWAECGFDKTWLKELKNG